MFFFGIKTEFLLAERLLKKAFSIMFLKVGNYINKRGRQTSEGYTILSAHFTMVGSAPRRMAERSSRNSQKYFFFNLLPLDSAWIIKAGPKWKCPACGCLDAHFLSGKCSGYSDDQNRDGGFFDHPFGSAADEDIGDDPQALGAHDDEITITFLGCLKDNFGGCSGFD